MALLEFRFFANALGMCTSMLAIVPNDAPPADGWPVFYLLHGLSDDHSIWLRRSNIERYMEGVPMVCVMPTTHRGWYTDSAAPPGLAYEKHMIEDVRGTIERLLPVRKDRGGRVIGGLSMGGYGAVKLGLKYHDLFCSVNSHSGAVLGPGWDGAKGGARSKRKFSPEFRAIFGDAAQRKENDCLALAEKCPKAKRPRVLVDCGVDDFLIEDNRAFHGALEELNFPHVYREFPGVHDWAYWDLHVQEAIGFHRESLAMQGRGKGS